MARPSISVPDELLNEFDDLLWEAKRNGDLDRDVDRSEVVRELMRLWMRSRGANIPPQNADIVEGISVQGGGFGGGFDPTGGGGGFGGGGSGSDDGPGGGGDGFF